MTFSHGCTRRNLIKHGIVTAAGLSLIGSPAIAATDTTPPADDRWRGLKIGVASYTLRSMPLDAALKAIRRVGLKYISIKDFHLPMKSTPAQRREVAEKCKAAGVTPLSCGVIYMKNETEARQAFEYARDTGISTIVCAPTPDLIPALDKMVKEFDMRLAIHNHGPESKEFRSPLDVWPAIENYDKRIGLCIDIGHTLRVGVNPAEAILKCHQRVYDVHFKDISKADPKGGCIEAGRGVMDFKAIFQALLSLKYADLIGIEYEKDGNDPLPGLSETIGYMKGILANIQA